MESGEISDDNDSYNEASSSQITRDLKDKSHHRGEQKRKRKRYSSSECSNYNDRSSRKHSRKRERSDKKHTKKRRKRSPSSSSSSSSSGSSRSSRSSSRSSRSSSSDSSSSSSSNSSSASSHSSDKKATINNIVKKPKVEHIRPTLSALRADKKVGKYIPDYLCEYFNCSDFDLRRVFNLQHIKIKELLVGKQAAGYYGKQPIKFKISDVTTQPARNIPAYPKAPPHFTILSHYSKKQNIRLKFPDWPCLVQQGGGGHCSYFPIELLFLLN